MKIYDAMVSEAVKLGRLPREAKKLRDEIEARLSEEEIETAKRGEEERGRGLLQRQHVERVQGYPQNPKKGAKRPPEHPKWSLNCDQETPGPA